MTTATDKTPLRIPRRLKRKVDAAHPVYELDLWLVDSDPLIWRTLAVPADFTLLDLHCVIQAAMPWGDYHLHEFQTAEGRRFEPVQQVGGVDAMWKWIGGDEDGEDESRFTLRDLFDELRQKMAYIYDMGDDWTHGLKLITSHADAAPFAHIPVCLAGAMAGPPEDSGGTWGYYEKLEVLRHPDPDDEWHQQVIEWMGGRDFDPAAFDLAAVNRHLKAMMPRKATRRERGARSRSATGLAGPPANIIDLSKPPGRRYAKRNRKSR